MPMRITVDDVMRRISATVNQEAAVPDAGSDEWNLWLIYINRAQNEWANVHDWEILKKYYYPAVTGESQATVMLPLDFNKLAAQVRIYYPSKTEPVEIPWTVEEERSLYVSTDSYLRITGDYSTGRSLIFNPATLASGASLQVIYFSMPTSLASGTQYPLVPDPEYLVDRVTAFILEARSDPRYQINETKARERLLNMVQMADEERWTSYSNQVPVTNTMRRSGFRVGRD